MARKESDLVANDSWNISGLVNSHAMHDWCERRVKGILSAELTEACRKHVAENILGLSMTGDDAKDSREAVAKWIKDEANKAAYDTLRAELRTSAQGEFDEGTYGQGTRGPVADPPRVAALFPFVQSLYEQAGKGDLLASTTREQRITLVSKFEGQYGGPRGKYHKEIASLTANIVAPPSAVQMLADL